MKETKKTKQKKTKPEMCLYYYENNFDLIDQLKGLSSPPPLPTPHPHQGSPDHTLGTTAMTQ